MKDGKAYYKHFIDELVEEAPIGGGVHANSVRCGEVKGVAAESSGLNALLKRLSEEERAVLADYVSEAYAAGIFKTLELLGWHFDCHGLKFTVEDTPVLLNDYQGPYNDFIGRRAGWVWPDEREKPGE